MATFVLVPGAWHGGWCWNRVTPFLCAAGHTVVPCTLTGLGERVHLATPEVGLETHIQDVGSVLEFEDLREVVLVGHSYGGMVITGVAERVPERLAHLVYLDAFVPEDGEALVDLVPPTFGQEREALVEAEGEGWKLPRFGAMPWATFLPQVWEITSQEDLDWMLPRLVPQPYRTFTERVRCGNPAAHGLPRTYIRCVRPPSPAFVGFAEAARQPGSGWRYRELETGHDAMVTMPRELADLLLEAAG